MTNLVQNTNFVLKNDFEVIKVPPFEYKTRRIENKPHEFQLLTKVHYLFPLIDSMFKISELPSLKIGVFFIKQYKQIYICKQDALFSLETTYFYLSCWTGQTQYLPVPHGDLPVQDSRTVLNV